MIGSISSNTPLLGNQGSAAVQAPAMQAATAQAPQGDVVQLSNAAQAKLLKQQGLDVAQIAIKLGLDAKTVATYFPSVGSKG